LARKNAVVRRLASLHNLASVHLLLSDKTGTLTKNLITIHKIIGYGRDEAEKNMNLIGLLLLSDTLHEDAKEVINFLHLLGLSLGKKLFKIL
jgi:magnesium-transporting ATPase (P-type)